MDLSLCKTLEKAVGDIEALVRIWADLGPSEKSEVELIIDSKITALQRSQQDYKDQPEHCVLQCLVRLRKTLAELGFVSDKMSKTIAKEIEEMKAKNDVEVVSEKSSDLVKGSEDDDRVLVNMMHQYGNLRFPLISIWKPGKFFLRTDDENKPSGETYYCLEFQEDDLVYNLKQSYRGVWEHVEPPEIIDTYVVDSVLYALGGARVYLYIKCDAGKVGGWRRSLGQENVLLEMGTAENAKAFVEHLAEGARDCHPTAPEIVSNISMEALDSWFDSHERQSIPETRR